MTKIEKSSERTSTGIVYKTAKTYNHGKNRIKVTIRLDDECRNKHVDFKIGADVYEINGGRPEWIACGCCHEEILKAFPEFAPFVKLHLSDVHGAPLYAVANSIYWFKEKGIQAGAEYLRIDPKSETAAALCRAAALDSEIYFSYLLEASGVVAQWAKEAAAAVAFLEELSGLKFENPYKPEEERAQFCPFSAEERAEIENKIKAGYFTPLAQEERIKAAEEEKREKARAAIVERYDKEIKEAQESKRIILLIFDLFGTAENTIYYNHSKKLAFNWKSYDKKQWTAQEIKKADRSLKDAGLDIVITDEAKAARA